ncbi:aspartate aminotransferase family protein, partial [Sinorhizobium meliloti]
MKEETTREILQCAAEHAARFREKITELPQRPELSYPAALETFRETLPERGSAGSEVIGELAAKAEPGLHAMTGPRFFGWVIGGSH